jgi:hypothetical protein
MKSRGLNAPAAGSIRDPEPTRLPILLTAFVWPGVGQFVQRRWIPAVFFTVGFLICAVCFFSYAVRLIVAYYGTGLHFDTFKKPELPIRPMVVWFVVAVVLSVAAIVDAFVGYVGQRSKWNRRRHGLSMDEHGTVTAG